MHLLTTLITVIDSREEAIVLNQSPQASTCKVVSNPIMDPRTIVKDHAPKNSEEEPLETIEVSDEMQRVLKDEDPNFQAP